MAAINKPAKPAILSREFAADTQVNEILFGSRHDDVIGGHFAKTNHFARTPAVDFPRSIVMLVSLHPSLFKRTRVSKPDLKFI
jgi:hypothetical protein